MGKVSREVISEMRKSIERTRKRKVVQISGFWRPKDVKTIDELIGIGCDPVHATYVLAQNIRSYFTESISGFPALDEFYQIADYAINEYMPSGRPWSPLTGSYTSC